MSPSKSIQAVSASGEPAQQSIEELQKRYSSLNTKKIQAETHLDNARKKLEELQAEARENYGTDDVEQLRRKLAEMKSENEAKRRQYQSDLDAIEADLQAVEDKFADETASAHPEGAS